MRVSYETIYRTLFVQARGALKKEFMRHLRCKRRLRCSRAPHKTAHGQIIDAISIRESPAAVEDRAIPGHWEGDLLLGAKWSQIAMLVERQSRFTTLVRVPSRNTDNVVSAVARHIRKLHLRVRAQTGRASTVASFTSAIGFAR